jgi:hypothetical protein
MVLGGGGRGAFGVGVGLRQHGRSARGRPRMVDGAGGSLSVETNENYQLTAGSGLTIDVTLKDSAGNPVTTFDGTQALTTTVWPGGSRAVTFSPATTWTTPAAGTFSIAVTPAETAGLAAGSYQLLTRLSDTSGDVVDCYGCTLEVQMFAGSAPTPKMYCGYADLLRYGRSWLEQLQTDDDEAGFAEQIGRATSWIDDLAHAHFRVASMVMVVGCQAMGPRRSGARSTWLQAQLDAMTILFTDQLREACAKKALAYICEGQVGVTEAASAYGRLGRMYHSQADYLGTCLTISLDTDGDGFPDVNIDCSSTDPMYG